MKQKIIIGLDIGSASIKGAAGALTQNGLQIVGQAKAQTFGVRKGIIVDIEETAKSVREVLNVLSQSAHRKLEEACAIIGGTHLLVRPSQGVVAVALASNEITTDDVLRVISAAKTISLPKREILQVIPLEYLIDGEGGVKEPVGMFGVRLEAKVLIIDGALSFVKNFRKVLESAGLRDFSLAVNPLAAARALLDKRQKELGTAVVDLGAGTTAVSVFEEGELVHFQIFGLGSSQITNDLAIAMRTSINIAEKIKCQYGTCLPKSVGRKDQPIHLASLGSEGRGYCTRKEAALVIERRVLEILQTVQKELKRIGRAQMLPGGVVLCGGGSLLGGIEELSRKVFKLPVKTGSVSETGSIEPEFAAAFGAMLWAFDLEKSGQSGSLAGPWAKIKKLFRFFLP